MIEDQFQYKPELFYRVNRPFHSKHRARRERHVLKANKNAVLCVLGASAVKSNLIKLA